MPRDLVVLLRHSQLGAAAQACLGAVHTLAVAPIVARPRVVCPFGQGNLGEDILLSDHAHANHFYGDLEKAPLNPAAVGVDLKVGARDKGLAAGDRVWVYE